jgi:hypothetical protein
VDLAREHDAFRLLNHRAADEHLLLDQLVVLVVGVVRVPELAIRAQLELQELVAEPPLVTLRPSRSDDGATRDGKQTKTGGWTIELGLGSGRGGDAVGQRRGPP